MNHPTDGHHPFPSSSQTVHHFHRSNPAHTQVMIGHNQRLTPNIPRRIEHLDGGYISCGTGRFTGRTIRAEVREIQKANVGRKCVSLRAVQAARS